MATNDTTDEKMLALAAHFKVDVSEISEERNGEYTVESEPGEYAVMTNDEADQAWDESLDSYIDDCIMPEIKDENLKQYFDTEAWKRDARHDGRGHCLSSYDGDEHEVKIGDTYYYIYRTN